MRKRRKKIKVNQATLLAIFAIILVLVGAVIFLEKGMHIREAPKVPLAPPKPVETALIIKGCLFDLGIHKEQITIHDHTLKVESHKKTPSIKYHLSLNHLRNMEMLISEMLGM